LAILEEQITIGVGRENPREIPARPAQGSLQQATVAGARSLEQDQQLIGPRRPASFATENQPGAGLAGFSCGQSPLTTIVIFPSKTAKVMP
jgi:hypothetical protein